jgi:flagellar biosynthesis/type III secretory pathway protein FliH
MAAPKKSTLVERSNPYSERSKRSNARQLDRLIAEVELERALHAYLNEQNEKTALAYAMIDAEATERRAKALADATPAVQIAESKRSATEPTTPEHSPAIEPNLERKVQRAYQTLAKAIVDTCQQVREKLQAKVAQIAAPANRPILLAAIDNVFAPIQLQRQVQQAIHAVSTNDLPQVLHAAALPPMLAPQPKGKGKTADSPVATATTSVDYDHLRQHLAETAAKLQERFQAQQRLADAQARAEARQLVRDIYTHVARRELVRETCQAGLAHGLGHVALGDLMRDTRTLYHSIRPGDFHALAETYMQQRDALAELQENSNGFGYDPRLTANLNAKVMGGLGAAPADPVEEMLRNIQLTH